MVMARTPKVLRGMIWDLEKFSEESGLEAYEQKTKIMIFRKGQRIEKEIWGRELVVINEYKYLDF